MHLPRLHTIKRKCKNCGKEVFNLDPETQETICINCGQVIQIKIEDGVEWRSFEGEEEARRRVDMPPNLMLPDKGLSTVIGAENKDTAGTMIGGTVKRKLNRLRKWQRRISFYSSKEKHLAYSLNELDRMGVELNVPRSILEMASYVYRMAMEKGLLRGRSKKKLITASMYVAIRHEGVPRTLKELSQVSGIDRIQIAKYFRLLLKGLKIKLPLADPVNFVAKICSRAGLSKKVMLEAQKIIRLAQEEGLTTGKDPAAVAAVATYYACILLDVEVTKQDIADAADVSDVTIRTIFQALKKSITNF